MNSPLATNLGSTSSARNGQVPEGTIRESAATRRLGESATPFAEVAGIVIHGDRRGRELGFPTANVAPDITSDLPDGVFAGTALCEDGTLHLAAVSVGTRETFYAHSAVRLIEAYLLDFDGELYGELIEISLYCHLRVQERFDVLDELIAQITRDVSDVRATFTGHELVGHGIPPSATTRSPTQTR